MSEESISPHDAEQLQRCFTAYARELYGYACVLARGDRALAEDLVQAAFEAAGQAWPTLGRLAEEQRPGWLRTTLATIAVNGFRQEKAIRGRPPPIDARDRSVPAAPPEQAFSSIALERCWQVIQEMPEGQHAVALLRWQLDMKEAEIAAVLGLAEKTVTAQLHQARHALIARLGPELGGGTP